MTKQIYFYPSPTLRDENDISINNAEKNNKFWIHESATGLDWIYSTGICSAEICVTSIGIFNVRFASNQCPENQEFIFAHLVLTIAKIFAPNQCLPHLSTRADFDPVHISLWSPVLLFLLETKFASWFLFCVPKMRQVYSGSQKTWLCCISFKNKTTGKPCVISRL